MTLDLVEWNWWCFHLDQVVVCSVEQTKLVRFVHHCFVVVKRVQQWAEKQ